MEKIIKGHVLTSNEELDSFQVGDNTVEVTGVILRLDPAIRRRSSSENANTPFRCIFSNLTGRQIRLLFWPPKKEELEGTILKQIVKIARPQVILRNSLYSQNCEELMNIELSIQKSTTVELLGVIPKSEEEDRFNKIELKDAGNAVGQMICVQAYIRTAIDVATSATSSYGSGAITDGHYRLPINITKFDGSATVINKGSLVEIQGKMRTNDYKTVILQVPDTEHITVINSEEWDWNRLKPGFHPIIATIEKTKGSDNNVQAHGQRRRSNGEDDSTSPKVSRGDDDSIEFDLFI